MNKLLYTRLLNEAAAIGDSLLNSCIVDENGTYWKTLSLDDNLDVVESITENMYNGTSGIALFFLDLHKITGVKKYLDCGISAMNWVFQFCNNNKAFQYGFYTGRISVSIVALRYYEFTKDIRYLSNALNVIKDIKHFNPEFSVDDLIGGNGGTFLGLMHLHAYTNEDWVLEEMNRFAGFLMDRMYIGKKGIYWDRIPDFVTGLCGFSHGAAGLAFIFLEAGHYLNNEAFYWLAKKAFEYESQYFNKDFGNWVDLRRHKTTKQFIDQQRNAFFNNDIEYFTKDRFMNAWCHGAAGIGLARLRAFELLKDKNFLNETNIAVKTTIASDTHESAFNNLMIYCHGNCGNAELFIESSLKTNDNRTIEYAEKAAEMAMKHKEVNGFYRSDYRVDKNSVYEDKSLFTGIAGIGHYYLRVLNPQSVTSILMPSLNKVINVNTDLTNYENLDINVNKLRLKAFKRVFPKTISIIENIDDNFIRKTFEIKDTAYIARKFKRFFNEYSKSLATDERIVLNDVFEHENTVFKACSSIKSFALLDIKRIIEDEKAIKLNSLTENDLMEKKLIINDTVVLCKTKWDWNSVDNYSNLRKKSGTHYIVLQKQPKGITEFNVTPLVYTILSIFKTEDKVINKLNQIKSIFGLKDENEIMTLNTIMISQIKELISSHYLIEV